MEESFRDGLGGQESQFAMRGSRKSRGVAASSHPNGTSDGSSIRARQMLLSTFNLFSHNQAARRWRSACGRSPHTPLR